MANSGGLEVSVLSDCLSQDSLIKTSTWPCPRKQDLQGHHHSKSVNNLRITEQKNEIPDNFHFTVLYKSILQCGMLIIYKVCRQIRCMMYQKFETKFIIKNLKKDTLEHFKFFNPFFQQPV